MRIGEFATKHDLTIDTIRHYMDLELLLPEKKGGHYFFGKKEEEDLKEILDLKELKFTLSEVQRIVLYTRLSQVRTKEDKNYIRNILLDKKNALDEEERGIKNALDILKNKIIEIDNTDIIEGKREQTEVKMGIPLGFLQNLSCPICDASLELEDGKITKNMVIEGYFKCSCGYRGDIENGIYISLDDEDRKRIPIESIERKRKEAITLGEYMDGTEPALINHIYKSIDSIISFIDLDTIENKVILELGTGSGFFIRQFLSYINSTNIYIVTDHNIHRMKVVKSYVEEHFKDGKFVFICADLSKLPIRSQTVDYILNYTTSLNYSLNSDRLLDTIMISKLKKGGKQIGCSYYGKSSSKLLKSLPVSSRSFFEEKAYKNAILGLDLSSVEFKEVGSLDGESKYEPMLKGDQIYTLTYCGKK